MKSGLWYSCISEIIISTAILGYLYCFIPPVLFPQFSTSTNISVIKYKDLVLKGEEENRLWIVKVYCKSWNFICWLTGLQIPNCAFPCSHQVCFHPAGKAPHPAHSLLSLTSWTPPGCQLNNNGPHLTPFSNWQNYSNKPITYFYRKQELLILLLPPTFLPQPLLVRSTPRCNPHVVPHGVWCPPQDVSVCD